MRERKSRAFTPTDEQRRGVSAMAVAGIEQKVVAKILGIGVQKLRRHFREELDMAMAKANTKVAGVLYGMAISGKSPVSTIFWLKTRARWRETDHGKFTAETDGPTKFTFRIGEDAEPDL